MLQAPAEAPVTIPVAEPITAISVLELLHVPPGVALLNVEVPPGVVVVVPVIGAGAGFTVIGLKE